MKMAHVTIHTSLQEDCIRFYEEVLGLKIVTDMRDGLPPKIVFMADSEEDVKVEIIQDPLNAAHVSGLTIGFHCEDVDAEHERIKALGKYEVSPIITPNAHVKFFFVTDPSGVKVQLI